MNEKCFKGNYIKLFNSRRLSEGWFVITNRFKTIDSSPPIFYWCKKICIYYQWLLVCTHCLETWKLIFTKLNLNKNILKRKVWLLKRAVTWTADLEFHKNQEPQNCIKTETIKLQKTTYLHWRIKKLKFTLLNVMVLFIN